MLRYDDDEDVEVMSMKTEENLKNKWLYRINDFNLCPHKIIFECCLLFVSATTKSQNRKSSKFNEFFINTTSQASMHV